MELYFKWEMQIDQVSQFFSDGIISETEKDKKI